MSKKTFNLSKKMFLRKEKETRTLNESNLFVVLFKRLKKKRVSPPKIPDFHECEVPNESFKKGEIKGNDLSDWYEERFGYITYIGLQGLMTKIYDEIVVQATAILLMNLDIKKIWTTRLLKKKNKFIAAMKLQQLYSEQNIKSVKTFLYKRKKWAIFRQLFDDWNNDFYWDEIGKTKWSIKKFILKIDKIIRKNSVFFNDKIKHRVRFRKRRSKVLQHKIIILKRVKRRKRRKRKKKN